MWSGVSRTDSQGSTLKRQDRPLRGPRDTWSLVGGCRTGTTHRPPVSGGESRQRRHPRIMGAEHSFPGRTSVAGRGDGVDTPKGDSRSSTEILPVSHDRGEWTLTLEPGSSDPSPVSKSPSTPDTTRYGVSVEPTLWSAGAGRVQIVISTWEAKVSELETRHSRATPTVYTSF